VHKGSGRILYVVVCAAPAATEVGRLVELAQDEGWQVCVVTTPLGRRFVDVDFLERLTAAPVRSEYRLPHEPKTMPLADAVVAAPVTFNTINKWATGIADTFAVSLLCEVMGSEVPILAVPLLKDELARHTAFSTNLTALRHMGVTVLFDPKAPPAARMPSWERILEELNGLVRDG
jgi:phosphopantothenoylcysteine synthetase/decarboxylase